MTLHRFPETEELVDAIAVANHLKLHVTLVRKMARMRRIPSLVIKNGSREFHRFRISEVEHALREEASEDTPRVVPERPGRPHPARKRA